MEPKVNKTLYLIKTHGCSACKCMEHILADIKTIYPDINVRVTYYPEVSNYIVANVPLTDFPTTVLMHDNIIKYHFVGTMSIKNIKKLFEDINF